MITARRKFSDSDVAAYDWDWEGRFGAQVEAELTQAFLAIILNAYPGLEPTMAQRYAVEYARARMSEVLTLDGKMSLLTLTQRRLRNIIADGIEQGQSLGEVAKRIRQDFAFSPERAISIARTESATALGQGEREAAILQGRDEKHWVTQADEAVESLCRSNEGQGWIPLREMFASGVDTIPAHADCRCVVRYRTKALHEDSVRMLAEVRCPRCDKRLPVSNLVGPADVYCKRCNVVSRVGA